MQEDSSLHTHTHGQRAQLHKKSRVKRSCKRVCLRENVCRHGTEIVIVSVCKIKLLMEVCAVVVAVVDQQGDLKN